MASDRPRFFPFRQYGIRDTLGEDSKMKDMSGLIYNTDRLGAEYPGFIHLPTS